MRCKDGSIRHVLISSNVLWDGDQFIHTRCFTRDITEHKLVEEREQRILSEVQAARSEAEMANRAKADFLAIMSHELRTPLNAIIGFAQLLDTEIAGPLNQAQKGQLERIDIGARHLLQLIEGILTFSRIEAGREEIHVEVTDLAELVRETCSLLQPLISQKNLGFHCQIDGSLHAETDPGKVRQILLNLISNAVKFTEYGEVRLQVRGDGSEAVIQVSDTGIGIAPEHLKRIFEPFSQVEQAASRRKGGTGLGLSVSQELVKLLSGSLDVQSELGQGTTFSVRLPLK